MIKQLKLDSADESYNRPLELSVTESHMFTYVQISQVIKGLMISGTILIAPCLHGFSYYGYYNITRFSDAKSNLVDLAKKELTQSLNNYISENDI